MVRHIMVYGCINRARAETIWHGKQEQHPVLAGDRKAEQAEYSKSDRRNHDPFCMKSPNHSGAEQRRDDRHERDRH